MTDTSTRWAGLRVTDDPHVEAQLRDRLDTMNSRDLAEYAHSIGLYPPGYGPAMDPPIAEVWLPGMPYEAEGVLMWDAGDGEEDT